MVLCQCFMYSTEFNHQDIGIVIMLIGKKGLEKGNRMIS